MENNEKPKAKHVETYTGDMVKILETGEGGLIKKIIEEEERKEIIKKTNSPESAQNKIFLLIGALLVVLSVGSIFFTVFFGEEIITAPIEPQFNPIIFTDKNFFIDSSTITDSRSLHPAIYDRINTTDVKKGGVEGIYVKEGERVMNLIQFLERTNSNFPKEGMSFLSSDFLIGAYRVENDVREPFILMKVRSFADIFPHMRAWESKIFIDLHSLLGIELTVENSYLQTKEFEDGITANKNTRILYDNEKNIVMEYVFADDNSILITRGGQSTINEIMKRIASSKVRK